MFTRPTAGQQQPSRSRIHAICRYGKDIIIIQLPVHMNISLDSKDHSQQNLQVCLTNSDVTVIKQQYSHLLITPENWLRLSTMSSVE